MSSLLQFSGKISRQGIRLEFIIEREIDKPTKKWDGTPTTFKMKKDAGPFIDCPICGKTHPQIYVAWRKPAGTFGHWVVFRYLGEEHVPDLSIPIGVPSVPRGAKALSSEENARTWHS